MTPQEKATELVEKYKNSIISFLSETMKNENAKQCALIAVEEIIKGYPFIPIRYMLESKAINTAIEYWNEVKAEIEKL